MMRTHLSSVGGRGWASGLDPVVAIRALYFSLSSHRRGEGYSEGRRDEQREREMHAATHRHAVRPRSMAALI